MYVCVCIYIYIYINIYQMSSSESWPRKVELTCINANYHEFLHIIMNPVITLTETSLTLSVIIS